MLLKRIGLVALALVLMAATCKAESSDMHHGCG